MTALPHLFLVLTFLINANASLLSRHAPSRCDESQPLPYDHGDRLEQEGNALGDCDKDSMIDRAPMAEELPAPLMAALEFEGGCSASFCDLHNHTVRLQI